MGTLKVLVGISNIFTYSALVLLFLGFGYENLIATKVASVLSYAMLFMAIIFFVIYKILRYQQLKIDKYKYKFDKNDVIFTWIFNVITLFFVVMILIWIIVAQLNLLNGTTTRIMFYVIFPITFIGTFTASVLESIVRVKEQIFIHKQTMLHSSEWMKKKKQQSENTVPLN